MIVTHDREQYNIVVCDGAAAGVVTLSKQNTAICPTIDHPSAWLAAYAWSWKRNNNNTTGRKVQLHIMQK